MRLTNAQPRSGLPPLQRLGGTHPHLTTGRPVPPAAVAEPVPAATINIAAIWLVLGGLLYNALLAFLGARGMPINKAMVAGAEFLVLGGAGLALLRSGFRPIDTPALLLIGFFVLDALAVSLMSGLPFPDMARNAAIIGLFVMLGARVDELAVRRVFAIAAALVFVILLLECIDVKSYAALLEPGRYFEVTRGISRFELDEIGLFANALGFDDRFSILNLVGHRTSSLFLEQVSLANFATVLTIFLVVMWPRLSWKVKLAYPLLIAMILVTNNSRTALAIALVAPIIYYVAPKLPSIVTLLLVPMVLAAAVVVDLVAPPSREDDLVGRLSLTVRTLKGLDASALIGARAGDAANFLDSGYTFVIYASSLIGMIVLWLFLSFISAGEGAAQRRASLMSGLYLFLNLTVSGTSVFSIKTAALLWLLVGFLREEARATKAVAGPATA